MSAAELPAGWRAIPPIARHRSERGADTFAGSTVVGVLNASGRLREIATFGAPADSLQLRFRSMPR